MPIAKIQSVPRRHCSAGNGYQYSFMFSSWSSAPRPTRQTSSQRDFFVVLYSIVITLKR